MCRAPLTAPASFFLPQRRARLTLIDFGNAALMSADEIEVCSYQDWLCDNALGSDPVMNPLVVLLDGADEFPGAGRDTDVFSIGAVILMLAAGCYGYIHSRAAPLTTVWKVATIIDTTALSLDVIWPGTPAAVNSPADLWMHLSMPHKPSACEGRIQTCLSYLIVWKAFGRVLGVGTACSYVACRDGSTVATGPFGRTADGLIEGLAWMGHRAWKTALELAQRTKQLLGKSGARFIMRALSPHPYDRNAVTVDDEWFVETFGVMPMEFQTALDPLVWCEPHPPQGARVW